MPQSKMNCVQDVVEAATLYFFADRKQIGIDSDSGSLEEVLSVIGYSHVNAPRQAGLNEVACGKRVGRNIETACKIIKRAKWHDAQGRLRADECGSDLPHRPIATGHNYQVRSVAEALRCPVEQGCFRLGDHLFQRIADACQAVAHLQPGLLIPHAARRIQEYQGTEILWGKHYGRCGAMIAH